MLNETYSWMYSGYHVPKKLKIEPSNNKSLTIPVTERLAKMDQATEVEKRKKMIDVIMAQLSSDTYRASSATKKWKMVRRPQSPPETIDLTKDDKKESISAITTLPPSALVMPSTTLPDKTNISFSWTGPQVVPSPVLHKVIKPQPLATVSPVMKQNSTIPSAMPIKLQTFPPEGKPSSKIPSSPPVAITGNVRLSPLPATKISRDSKQIISDNVVRTLQSLNDGKPHSFHELTILAQKLMQLSPMVHLDQTKRRLVWTRLVEIFQQVVGWNIESERFKVLTKEAIHTLLND